MHDLLAATVAAFGIVFFAELGDKIQIATATPPARSNSIHTWIGTTAGEVAWWHDRRSGRIITPSGAAPNLPSWPPPKPAAVYSHPDGGRMDTGQIYFNLSRTHYDDLRQRMQTDTEYLASIQPPGLR